MEINEIMEAIKLYADKAMDQVGKAGKAAKVKTENAVQKAKIRYGIAEIQSKKKDIYAAMGEKLYAEYLRDGIKNEVVEEDYEKIDELNDELNDLEIKLASCKDSVKCDECGSYNDESNEYCAKCGAKLPRTKSEPEYADDDEIDDDDDDDDDTVIEVSSSDAGIDD